MKWPSAKKNKIRMSLIIASVFLILCVLQSMYMLSHTTSQSVLNKGQVQIGFYDLLSDKEEHYNIQIMDINGAMLLTITSLTDTTFLIKGRLDEGKEKNGRLFYSYVPVRYNNPQDYKMIFSFVDFFRHTDVWVYPLVVNKQPLLVSQSGLMFVYALKK
ncbi:hypothetical protein [Citrobacter portucalensis]|uniref:hypothetical protein n=1 Tax=Citrobacter portucalensis TaxID=1639133 RepID=UPI003CF687F1